MQTFLDFELAYLIMRSATAFAAMLDFAMKVSYVSNAIFAGESTQKFFQAIIIGRLLLPIIPWAYTVILTFQRSTKEIPMYTYMD